MSVEERPWCWRVRFYFKHPRGLFESGADGAFPKGTTAIQAILEVASWRSVDLDRVHSVDAQLLIPDPNLQCDIDWSRAERTCPYRNHHQPCDCGGAGGDR